MTIYDFSGGGPQWGSVYSMGGQSQQNLLPHVSHAPPPPVQTPWDHSSPYRLTVKQQPERAKAANAKDKDRKPVDPPPILQLDVDPNQDPLQVYITSPYLFVQTFLIAASDSDPEPDSNSLTGNTCTSGHVVKDDRGIHNMMFCLNDISVKKEGTYRLKFCLFKLNTATGDVENLTSICSQPFTTYSGRHFPGMSESTSMTRLLVDAGVRLRLRKESKAMSTKKKNNAFAQMMSRRAGGGGVGSGGGGGGDDDDDRPIKRMRSEPHHDRDSLPPSKHSSSSFSHAYNPPPPQQHSTPGAVAHYSGAPTAWTTPSPGQNSMAPMQHALGGGGPYVQHHHHHQQQLGLDTTQVPSSHYHSPPSAGSSYQSPGGRQSPSVVGGYPTMHHHGGGGGGGTTTSSLAHFGSGGSGHTVQLPPPVDMGGSHGSSSPDLNYTTSTNYNGGYMSSQQQSGASRTLPGMQQQQQQQQQQRVGSMGGPGQHMPMRMGLQHAHAGYGDNSLFEYGGYGRGDGH